MAIVPDQRANGKFSTTADFLERQPPYDLNAEKGVLGSILLMPEVIDEVILIIRAEDYFDEAHQQLY